jgi:predicted SnoaL-like aldol condensation-catalyzing enzyme
MEGFSSRTPMTDLEPKKETALDSYDLYDLAFNQTWPWAVIARYAADQYIQYNPGVTGGKEGFIKYFEEIGRRYPGKRVHFKQIIAGAHEVALPYRQEWPRSHDWVGLDIFLLDDAVKIVEHCDVLPISPEASATPDDIF